MPLSIAIKFFVWLLIAFILASRNMYIALDDDNYLAYFVLADRILEKAFDDWWRFLLDEPLWVIYCSFMSTLYSPEAALRLTIFISSLLFLISCDKLSRHVWLLLVLAFILDSALATQLYFNQLRQGFALSVFFTMIAIGLNPLLGAATCALIHSSFIIVFSCYLIAYVKNKYDIHFVVVILAILIVLLFAKNHVTDIDFGRRTKYQLTSQLTIFFYIGSIFEFGLFILLYLKYINKDFYKKEEIVWIDFSIIMFIVVLCLTTLHEAAGRLMYPVKIFTLIALCAHYYKANVRYLAPVWIALLLLANVNEARKIDWGDDSFFRRWEIILNI